MYSAATLSKCAQAFYFNISIQMLKLTISWKKLRVQLSKGNSKQSDMSKTKKGEIVDFNTAFT